MLQSRDQNSFRESRSGGTARTGTWGSTNGVRYLTQVPESAADQRGKLSNGGLHYQSQPRHQHEQSKLQ